MVVYSLLLSISAIPEVRTAIATTTTNETCGSANGTLTLGVVTGGVGPFTYSVDVSAYTATTSYANLSAGSHSIDVKDANGCIFSTSVNISNTPGPSGHSYYCSRCCMRIHNGSITLGAVTGGVSPYTYSVDGSPFTATPAYTNMAAGSHPIDVKDANGCIFSTSVNISNTGGPTAIATTTTNETCGSANGTLTLGVVTGGVGPFTYSVDVSAYTATTSYTNLSAGAHSIDVKDANGCIFSTSVNISNTPGPSAIATTAVDAACGLSNGSITLGAVTGGVAPYTYSVDGSPFTATLVYTNLAAGSHPIDVMDANGCIFSTAVNISNTGGPTAIATTTTNETCGSANGTLTLGVVTGGVGPFTYSVDVSAYTATTSYTNLSAGAHSIDVKDANGCIFSTSVNISNTPGPSAIATTVVDAACGFSNGSITLGAVTGGVSPYTYSVDGSPFTATLVYTNLAAASHPIDVMDANGCIFSTLSTSVIPAVLQLLQQPQPTKHVVLPTEH